MFLAAMGLAWVLAAFICLLWPQSASTLLAHGGLVTGILGYLYQALYYERGD